MQVQYMQKRKEKKVRLRLLPRNFESNSRIIHNMNTLYFKNAPPKVYDYIINTNLYTYILILLNNEDKKLRKVKDRVLK